VIERVTDPAVLKDLIFVNDAPPVRERVLSIVASAGAILKGHFQLQGGWHSEYLIRFRQIGRDPEIAAELARLLIPDHSNVANASIVCPESSGYFLGRAVSLLTGSPLTVARIDHSRRPTSEVRSGPSPKPGAPSIIVNDVLTTGASLNPLMELVRTTRATVDRVVVFATLNPTGFRDFMTANSITGKYLVSANWPTFEEKDCILCRQGAAPLPAAEFN
jgi:orotate phosphoribosyltransferase